MSDTVINTLIGGLVSIVIALLGNIVAIYTTKKQTATVIENKNAETKAVIEKETNAVKLGVQAVLRSSMISMYDKYKNKGYAPIYAKENFENMWLQYEALGANGVMSGIHDEFMELETNKGETTT